MVATRFAAASALVLAASLLPFEARAQCAPGTSWTQTWIDPLGETTYTLTAPCKVNLGVPFDIVATATDAAHPSKDVATGWAILDNGATIAGGGFNWLTLDASGQWQRTISRTYTGAPIDHTIQFRFTDLGAGSGAHFWNASLVGGLTVDPYPPVADAGPDLVLATAGLPGAEVAGTASDPDGDPLAYRWLEGGSELQPSQPVGPGGAAPLYLDGLLPLALGEHVFTLEVTDGVSAASDAMVLVVEGSAPTAQPSAAGARRAGSRLTLSGTVADWDGDLLTYHWLEGARVLASGTVAAIAGGTPVVLPPLVLRPLPRGVHRFVLAVSDGVHAVEAELLVTVGDRRPAR